MAIDKGEISVNIKAGNDEIEQTEHLIISDSSGQKRRPGGSNKPPNVLRCNWTGMPPNFEIIGRAAPPPNQKILGGQKSRQKCQNI